MPLHKMRELLGGERVLRLPVGEIAPNPNQPRRVFDQGGLDRLAASIAAHGVLCPLSVRRMADGWELIAGERRLRAATLAGLAEVPCLVVETDDAGSSLLALVENVQRRDLNFVEEAAALAKLHAEHHLTQEEVARQVGRSQSAVANKLRILRLPEDVLQTLVSHGFTERHARALLPLPDGESQRKVAQRVVRGNLTVAQTERCVAARLAALAEPPVRPKSPTFLLPDVRLFLNSLDRNVRLMQSAGVAAQVDRRDETDGILLTIRIPRAPRTP